MINFYKKTGVLTLAFLLVGVVVYGFLIPQYYLPIFPFLLLFFVLVTGFVHLALMKGVDKGNKFIFYFLISTVIKLFAYVLFFGIYVFLNRTHGLMFTPVFLLLYFSYTTIELIALSKDLKRSN